MFSCLLYNYMLILDNTLSHAQGQREFNIFNISAEISTHIFRKMLFFQGKC